jgi:hypothetical protein
MSLGRDYHNNNADSGSLIHITLIKLILFNSHLVEVAYIIWVKLSLLTFHMFTPRVRPVQYAIVPLAAAVT